MLDIALFLVIVAVTPIPDLYFYPRLARSGARLRYYLSGMAYLWTVASCALALWIANGRPWSAMYLGRTSLLRAALGAALVLAYAALIHVQRRNVINNRSRLERIFEVHERAQALVPRTRAERAGFFALAITAGFCEEVLYRGYVTWFAARFTGLAAAVVISTVAFGVAHAYLGWKQVIRTSIGGLVFALIVLATGSLWPAIVIHALMDLLAGDLGFRFFNLPPIRSCTAAPA